MATRRGRDETAKLVDGWGLGPSLHSVVNWLVGAALHCQVVRPVTLVARAEAVVKAQQAEAAERQHRVEVERVEERSRRRMVMAGLSVAVLVVIVVLLVITGGH